MQTLKHEIDDKLAKQYRDDAISAGSDYGVDLADAKNLVDNLDTLCVKLHAELKAILADEILLDSIAIKNAAIVYLYLKMQHPKEVVEWYQHDVNYGDNTYPVRFGSFAIFPKQWFKDAITSGQPGQLKKLYSEGVADNESSSGGNMFLNIFRR